MGTKVSVQSRWQLSAVVCVAGLSIIVMSSLPLLSQAGCGIAQGNQPYKAAVPAAIGARSGTDKPIEYTRPMTAYQPVVVKNHNPAYPPDGSSILPTDLMYLGAFRLPDSGDEYGWLWSGHALAYYPDGDPDGPNDGYSGSLFGTGHDHKQWISEISIPTPIVSPTKNVSDLNTAVTLQDFHNIRGTLFDGVAGFDDFPSSLPKAGLAYVPAQGAQTTGKLHFCWGYHLQQVPQNEPTLHGEPEVSHGWCELDLSNPQPAGAWTIGDYINFVTNDYLFPIDPNWAMANTPGRLLATGRFRDGGQGSRGPSLFAYGPWNDGNPPAPGMALGATPLLAYSNILTGDDHVMAGYSHADEWTGGAWLTVEDKSAVVFVGTKGIGDTWYGFSDGTVWPEEPPFPPEGPGERGWWADQFEGQIIFYRPADLAAVAQGQVEAWAPQPYATLNIDTYLYHVTSARERHHVGAAAFDARHGLLYVIEPLADGDRPLIHAWQMS